MNEDYFPLGIAQGHAFLGRENEAHQLVQNIAQRRHTLLLAPRRYGKTSLARYAIQMSQCIYTEIDLFLAIDESAVESCFITGIESLIQTVSGKKEQWFHLLVDYFKHAEHTWTVGFKGLQLELKPQNHNDIPRNILEILNALEYVLSKQKKQVVVFIDEFQEISKIPMAKSIEGAIRHFAQSCKHVVFIFSGSSRHLLLDIFGSRSRPLYKLCDWISLSRLEKVYYQKYLRKVGKKTFQAVLPDETFDEIIRISACHPEATYALCGQLWALCAPKNKIPQKNDVENAWEIYIKTHLKQTRQILSGCSSGQLKILIMIATGYTKNLSGKNSQSLMGISSAAISKALHVLELEDYIEKEETENYRIVDPVIKSTLLIYYSDYLR